MSEPARTPSPELRRALEVHRELGWSDASADELLTLPVGTADQKQTLLTGLLSQEWPPLRPGRQGDLESQTRHRLALHLVRAGATAVQIVQVIEREAIERLPLVLIEGLATREGPLCREVADRLASGQTRADPATGLLLVDLVHRLSLPPPDSDDYLLAWLTCLERDLFDDTAQRVPGVRDRAAQHLRVAVDKRTELPRSFAAVLDEVLRLGLVPEDEVVDLLVDGAEGARRPGALKTFATALATWAHGDEQQVDPYLDRLIPLLARGEATTVRVLGPILVRRVDSEDLTEVLSTALGVRPRNARLAILRAATDREPSPDTLADADLWLEQVRRDAHPETTEAVRVLDAEWGLDLGDAPPSSHESAAANEYWRPTPPVWEVERSRRREANTAELTDLVTECESEWVGATIAADHLVDVLNRLAALDRDAALDVTRAVPGDSRPGLYTASYWEHRLEHHECARPTRLDSLQSMRDQEIAHRIGSLPAVLSLPTWVDGSVDPIDLLARLDSYRESDQPVSGADFGLALARLHRESITIDVRTALESSSVSVLDREERPLDLTSGQLVGIALAHPLQPDSRSKSIAPAALRDVAAGLADMLDHAWGTFARVVEFPYHYSLIPPTELDESSIPFLAEGVGARQVACSRSPLEPGPAMGLIGALKSAPSRNIVAVSRTVDDAWARGLLRPGVADLRALRRVDGPPGRVAALVEVLVELSERGMLAVTWPILRQVIDGSAAARRPWPGTADAIAAMQRFLPEVHTAIVSGVAAREELDSPGVRDFAHRRSPALVTRAAALLAPELPPSTSETHTLSGTVATSSPPESAELDPPFDDLWVAVRSPDPVIDGKAELSIEFVRDAIRPSAEPVPILVLRLRPHSEGPDEARLSGVSSGLWADSDLIARRTLRTRVVDEEPHLNPLELVSDPDRSDIRLQPWGTEVAGSTAPISVDAVASYLFAAAMPPTRASTAYGRHADKLYQCAVGPEVFRRAAGRLLAIPEFTPLGWANLIATDVKAAAVLWPLLTESIRTASQSGESPPRWLNRVLDATLEASPYLLEAIRRGRINRHELLIDGLHDLAERKGQQAWRRKAEKLRDRLSAD